MFMFVSSNISIIAQAKGIWALSTDNKIAILVIRAKLKTILRKCFLTS